MAEIALRRLGPEPWGRRLERARAAAGLNFREVEQLLFPHVSRSALVRLEQLPHPPTAKKTRARAALVVLLYGFDLSDFRLSVDDLPPVIDLDALVNRRGRRGERAPGKTSAWIFTDLAAA